MPPRFALELGRDHARYGEVSAGRLSPRTVWSMSVGADPESPAMMFKADPGRPNEDALLEAEQDTRVLLAVADSHFGGESSHDLLTKLALVESLPESPDELAHAVASLAADASAPVQRYESESTLLLVVYDRSLGSGFGQSYGDSTFAVVGDAGHRVPLERSRADFVSPLRSGTLDLARADTFTFRAQPGELLLAYTDGVNECHYHSPTTSIQPTHMAALWHDVDGDAERYVRALCGLALAGVAGHPGGEDNVAIAATRA